MKLRELRITYHRVAGADAPRYSITHYAQAAQIGHRLLHQEPVEVFGLLLLDTKHKVIAWHELARGTIDAVTVHPREVIKAACLANAAAVVAFHNHPSGDPTPSKDDMAILQRLQQALGLVGIELLDFVVIGEDPDHYYSYKATVR